MELGECSKDVCMCPKGMALLSFNEKQLNMNTIPDAQREHLDHETIHCPDILGHSLVDCVDQVTDLRSVDSDAHISGYRPLAPEACIHIQLAQQRLTAYHTEEKPGSPCGSTFANVPHGLDVFLWRFTRLRFSQRKSSSKRSMIN